MIYPELHSKVAFVAAGFSLRCTGETPVPPRKIGRKIFDWAQLGIAGEPQAHAELLRKVLGTL